MTRLERPNKVEDTRVYVDTRGNRSPRHESDEVTPPLPNLLPPWTDIDAILLSMDVDPVVLSRLIS